MTIIKENIKMKCKMCKKIKELKGKWCEECEGYFTAQFYSDVTYLKHRNKEITLKKYLEEPMKVYKEMQKVGWKK